MISAKRRYRALAQVITAEPCLEPENLCKRHRRIISGDGDNAPPSDHLWLGSADRQLRHTLLGELAGAPHYGCPCILRIQAEPIKLPRASPLGVFATMPQMSSRSKC